MKLFVALFFAVNNGSQYLIVSEEAFSTQEQCIDVATEMYKRMQNTPNTQIVAGKCSEISVRDKLASNP